MALRLAAAQRCVRVYLPNLRAVVNHFRTFSSHSQEDSYGTTSRGLEDTDITQVEWPDPALGPLRPVNRHFPLPGQIGATNQSSSEINAKPEELPHYFGDPLTLLPAQPCERHLGVLAHYLNHELKNSVKDMTEPFENTMPKPSDMLECVAYDCPQILRKDFSDLFPDRDISLGPFTALTLSQRTKNDMSAWSYDVEMEREELLETFMYGAMEICNALQKNGFWADFIDPSTGRPFNGPHTNASFCETDERYRRLGFQIEDLGCCKVIRHSLWGTHAYVSCLFTNAPIYHPIIHQLTKKYLQSVSSD